MLYYYPNKITIIVTGNADSYYSSEAFLRLPIATAWYALRT